MGYKLNLTFLLRPSCLTSVGLHALVLFYFSQNALKTTTVPSSGVPQIQRVSLQAVPTPTKAPEIEKVEKAREKVRPEPLPKKAKTKPVPKPIPDTPKKATESPQKTAQETSKKADREHPHFAPTPHYPRLARMRGLEGEVVIQLAVNSKGVPVKTELVHSSGHAVLDQAALEGLKKWRFEQNENAEVSQSIAFTTEKTVKFKLQ